MTHVDFLGFPHDAVAIVTGAAAGIGRATAAMLRAAGVRVSGWDRDGAAIAAWAADAPERTIGLHVDVTDRDAVRAALRRTEDDLGRAAFLVNNAGPPSPTVMSLADGLRSTIGSVDIVTEEWLATAGAENGSVVNVSSVTGSFIGHSSTAWYPAGKAAITGYTRYLAVHRPRGIRANVVAPGVTATERTREILDSERGRANAQRNPSRRPGEPRDVAAAIVFLLAPVSDYTNGVVLPVDGGMLVTL